MKRAASLSSRQSGTDFAKAARLGDETARLMHVRTRAARAEAKRVLKRPKGAAFPFHDPASTLHSALQAVENVTGAKAPDFTLESDPRQIFLWTTRALLAFGDARYEEGRRTEREGAEPRIRPDAALEALTLMTKLNDLLTT